MTTPPLTAHALPAGTRWPWGQIGLLLLLTGLCLNVLANGCLLLFGWSPGLFEVPGALLFATGLLTWLVAVFWNQRLRRRGQQIRKHDWLRQVNWSLLSGWALLKLLLLASILLRPAWSAAQATGRSAAHQAYLANRPGSWQTIRSEDGVLAMRVPQGWELLTEIAPQPNRIAQTDAQGNLGILAWSQPRENLAVTTLEDYSQVNIDAVSKGKDQFRILRHTSSLTPDPYVETELTWNEGPTRLSLLFQVRGTPQYFVQIRAWSSPVEFRNNAELLRKIIDSVQVDTAR